MTVPPDSIFIRPRIGWDVIGPGSWVRFQNQFIGPLPTDTHWQWSVRDTTESENIGGSWTDTRPINNLEQWIRLWIDGDAVDQLGQYAQFQPGTTVRLRFALVSPTLGTQTFTDQDLVWQPDAAPQEALGLQSASGGAALDARHAAMIEGTAAMVGLQEGGNLVQAAFNLFESLGSRVMSLQLIGDFEAGDGILNVPGVGVGGVAFGIAWQIVSYGPGIGVNEGNPFETAIPFLELTLNQRHDPIGDVGYSSSRITNFNGIIEWGLGGPVSVGWYVLPSCQVRLWWLKILVSPDPAASSSSTSSPTPG